LKEEKARKPNERGKQVGGGEGLKSIGNKAGCQLRGGGVFQGGNGREERKGKKEKEVEQPCLGGKTSSKWRPYKDIDGKSSGCRSIGGGRQFGGKEKSQIATPGWDKASEGDLSQASKRNRVQQKDKQSWACRDKRTERSGLVCAWFE